MDKAAIPVTVTFDSVEQADLVRRAVVASWKRRRRGSHESVLLNCASSDILLASIAAEHSADPEARRVDHGQ